jgi:hypothetical protein
MVIQQLLIDVTGEQFPDLTLQSPYRKVSARWASGFMLNSVRKA